MLFNQATVVGKIPVSGRAGLTARRLPCSLLSLVLLAMLPLSGCNNSLDLRAHSHDSAAEQALEQPAMQSAQASALSVTEAASAARYINNQDIMQEQVAGDIQHKGNPIDIAYDAASVRSNKPLPSEALIKQYAGRYTGQIPCTLQNVACTDSKLDMTLTLLPDGSAVRTLAEQGKVYAMLDKETAAWTVSANGQNILLVLPSHEIWSFKKTATNQLQFQPNASATLKPASTLGQYSLVASNS